MYNWGIRKNTNKVKNPVEGKFLADLDWIWIIVNPVDGLVLCMDSKRLQDLGASNVMLDEVYGILVVIYAWKFTPREGLASIPKIDHDGGLTENIDDSCSESTMTGGNVSECTDELAHMYEWEDMAACDLGLRTCTASPKVDCRPTRDYPKTPCVPAEEHHREKVVKVAKFINAMVSRPVGRAKMLSNTKAMDSMKKEWKGLVRYGSSIRRSLLHLPPRLFSLDNISDGMILCNFSFRRSMAKTSRIHLSIPYLRVFYIVSRLRAHHREQDNHRFFVPHRIAVRNHLQPAGPNANITFRFVNHNGTVLGLPGYAYVPGMNTGTEVTVVALDPNKPTVVTACSESHNCLPRLLNAGTHRLLRSLLRMTCYPSTGRTSPSTPSPKRVTCYFLLDPAREDHHGRD